jgi:hypothetical protein
VEAFLRAVGGLGAGEHLFLRWQCEQQQQSGRAALAHWRVEGARGATCAIAIGLRRARKAVPECRMLSAKNPVARAAVRSVVVLLWYTSMGFLSEY